LPDKTLSAYLSYCQEYMADSAGNVMNPARMLDIARRVVELSPDFARGWSARAIAAVYESRTAQAGNLSALRAEAEEAAQRAIKLDPKNSQAYEVLAGLKPRNSIEREKLHVQSVSVRPGDCGCEFVGYGGFLQNVGRVEAAASAFKRSHDMVPLSADVNAVLAEALFLTGKPSEARSIVDDLLEVWPNDPVRELLVRSALWTKDYEAGLAALADERSQFSDEERRSYSATMRAIQSGNAAEKASAISLLKPLTGRDLEDPRLLITALAALGADREALAEADKLIGPDGSRDQYLLFQPPFERIRRTPEFAAIVQRIGLIQYWRQSRHPPDFCRAPSAPALCRGLN
jgi:tetratricopeptide (TPR) repeat protein